MITTLAFIRPWLSRILGDWLYVDSPIWSAVGFMGAVVFSSRFVMQWLQTEKEKKLVVPWYFWHLSFWGSVLNLIYFIHLDKAPPILGNCFLPFVYLRSIIFVTRSGEKADKGGRKVFAIVASLFIVAAIVSVFVTSAAQREAVEQMKGLMEAAQNYHKTHGKAEGADLNAIVAHVRESADPTVVAIKSRLDKAHFKPSEKGVAFDPWNNPYRAYISADGMLIRSAGENRVFDEGSPNDHGDDLIFETRFRD